MIAFSKRMARARRFVLAAALFLGGLPPAFAGPADTNFWWTNNVTLTHLWSQATWSNVTVGPSMNGGNDYSISILSTLSTSITNDLGAFRLNRLQLATASASTPGAVYSAAGSYLVFVTNSSGAAPVIARSTGASVPRPLLIASDMILSNTVVFSTSITATNAAITNSIMLGGIVSGPGGIIKTGIDGLTFSNNATYTGGTLVSNGWLSIGAGTASGWVPGDITNYGTVMFNRSDTVTFSNVIVGTGGVTIGPSPLVTLISRGAGTVIFTGTNTYTGPTVLTAGTLSIASDTNIGASSILAFSGGVLQVTGTLLNNLDSRSVNWTNFNGGFDVASAANTFTVTNNVTGSSLLKAGAGVLLLSGTNSFSGTVGIGGGQLQLGSVAALQNATVSNGVAGGLFFNDAATSWTFGGLLGGADLALTNMNGAAVALTVGGANTNTTFGGALVGGGSLVKAGTGTLVLTNSANNVASVTVSSGILQLGNNTGFAGTNVLGAAVVTNNALVVFAGSANGSALYSNRFVGSGSLMLTQNQTLVYLSGSNAYSGNTLLVGGNARLAVGNDSALGSGSVSFLGSGAGGSTLSATGGAARTLANNLLILSNATLGSSADTGLLNLTGSADLGGAMRRLTVSSPVVLAGAVGNGGIVKLGSDLLTLSNAGNTFAGGVVVSNGTLGIWSDANLGNSAGGVTFAGGLLQVQGTSLTSWGTRSANWVGFNGGFDVASPDAAFTLTNAIVGAGPFTKTGAGTLVVAPTTFAGFAGTVTNNAGTLRSDSAFQLLNGMALVLSGSGLLSNSELQVSAGTLFLAGGSAMLDRLVSTNNLPGSYTNSYVTLNSGTLTTRSALIVPQAANNWYFGAGGLTWNVAGGTNVVSGAAAVHLGTNGYNVLNVSGSGTIFSNTGSFRIGSSFRGSNLMTISDGAIVASDDAQLGGGNNASNNVVVVTSGGTWNLGTSNTQNLVVGATGSGNLLLISNGGVVNSHGLGMGANSGATSNRVVVTGAGSTWNALGSSFYVAYATGAGGQLVVVTNGGLLLSESASIGQGATSPNNTVIVAGSGARWEDSAHIYVGQSSASNSLLVGDGGSVWTELLRLGQAAGSVNNLLAINGGDVAATNSAGNGILDLRWGTVSLAGGSVLANKFLFVTNAGGEGTFNWTGGDLTVTSYGAGSNDPSAILQNLLGGVGLGSVSTQTVNYSVNANPVFNSGLVLGSAAGGKGTLGIGGGTLTVTNAAGNAALLVGQGGVGVLALSGGTLTVDSLVATNNVVGGATNSVLQLNSGNLNSGPNGSTFTVVGALSLGSGGTLYWNMLGGTNVTAATTNVNLGGTAGGRAVATVSGPGTVWTNAALYLSLGAVAGSSGNELVISNQARLITGDAAVGGNASTPTASVNTSSNRVTVSDAGSIWDAGNIIVGTRQAAANQLIVTNGGLVRAASLLSGNVSVAPYESILVTGTGSTILVGGTLTVGNQGASNTLTVAQGGYVSNASTMIGYSTALNGDNGIVVTDPGSALISAGLLTVGRQSTYRNYLVVTNGGLVSSAGGGTIGAVQGSGGNWALVSDPGSAWRMAGMLRVGSDATNNFMVVSNGGQALVQAAGVLIGETPTSGGNSLIVTGAGSLLAAATNDLTVGYQGSTNSLVISGGAVVSNVDARVSSTKDAVQNSVLVTGKGSLWKNSGTVHVGSNLTTKGIGGSVLVSDGGTLSAAGLVSGWIGTGVISNEGGVFAFSVNNPTITTNTAGSIAVAGGTVEFEGVDAGNVTGQITRISYSGANTLRLNAATNAPASMTFGGGNSFSALEMVNGSTLWQGPALTVASDGSMLVSNTAAGVAGAFTNQGSVRVVNGTLTLGQPLTVGAGGTFTLVHATNVLNGGLVIASNAFYGGSGRVESGAGASSYGTISPGNSPGTLTFSSNLTLLDSSVLVLEIAGTNWADYDHLLVEGVFAKNGGVLVTNLGWAFALGDTFNFFDAPSLSGAFTATQLPGLDPGLFWDTTLFESQGLLSVVSIPEPSSLLAMGAALAALAAFRRRRA
jgi:autotransporter-associated beta strand protein/T5SS/PEP-CTERM-associated repeat protein